MITKKESWLSPNVEVRNSIIQGKGMFAKKQIKKGEIIYILGEFLRLEKKLRALMKIRKGQYKLMVICI